MHVFSHHVYLSPFWIELDLLTWQLVASREEMKKAGRPAPDGEHDERPMYVSCMGAVVDEYVPPEGDGKASIVSKEGAKQTAIAAQAKTKTVIAVRKIRKYDEHFDPRAFAAEEAQEIYVKSHEALCK